MEIRCVWWDGYHNAFTDIIKHKDRFFITFRHGTSHGRQGKGEIYVIFSKDLTEWGLVKKFPALIDSRDPKFFKFRDKLGVVFGAYSNFEMGKIDIYISYSEDGINWGKLIKIENYNLWFWRIRNFKEKLYATAYELKLEKGTYLYLSDNGINFKQVSQIVKGEYANESDLLFEDDGLCYAIVRRENWQTPIFAISQPPYKKWEKYNLNYIVQGPHIFKFKNQIYIAGRVYIKNGNLLSQKEDEYETKTAILKIDMENYKLIPIKILPSSGDTSYCGSIVDNERLFLTYYSQHELGLKESKGEKNASGIYLLTTESL